MAASFASLSKIRLFSRPLVCCYSCPSSVSPSSLSTSSSSSFSSSPSPLSPCSRSISTGGKRPLFDGTIGSLGSPTGRRRRGAVLQGGVDTQPTAAARPVVLHRRWQSGGYDGDGKTTVQIMNRESDYGLMVDSYSQIGFELNSGLMVLGPIALFPRTVLSWNCWNPESINEESLSLFYMIAPKLDILVVGAGDDEDVRVAQKNVLEFMREKKIGVEVLPTNRAITTFNFLNAEGRSVAGAFIPPRKVNVSDEDKYLTMKKRRALFIARDDDDD